MDKRGIPSFLLGGSGPGRNLSRTGCKGPPMSEGLLCEGTVYRGETLQKDGQG